jgi:hypothetical protein
VAYRGSRKHVLDWVEQRSFLMELLALADIASPRVSSKSRWMPRSYREPDEARLETFGPKWLPGHSGWLQMMKWWLKHEKGANTPNWDIALGCELGGKPGIILVEAKAHKNELKTEGKTLDEKSSDNSRENHAQIGAAIDAACRGLRGLDPSVLISRDSHYQLANRLAFTWKLATLGIPTVLIYLGFLGDSGIVDQGTPLTSEADWQSTFEDYAKPSACRSLFEQPLDCGAAPAWLLVRARAVLEISPPPA